jgi:ribosomal protein S18 acetylase RimI-like enzyme
MEATRNTEDHELRAWTDMFAASESLGLGVVETSGGTALVAEGVDSLLFNRAVARSGHEIDELVRVYADRNIDRYLITLPRGVRAEIAPALGLERFHRPWIKLGCRPEAQAAGLEGYVVRPARPEDADAVARLYCAGFDVPSTAVPVLAGLIGRPRWHVYVAEASEEPGRPIVGLGISYLARSHAYLFGGVTAPEHRSRGIQRALVAARVNHAHRCGATAVSTDTGVAIPGQPNHSQHNLERAGLRVLYTREHLAPRGTTWIRGVGR